MMLGLRRVSRRSLPSFVACVFAFAFALGVFVACGDDPTPVGVADSGRADAPFIDAGGGDGSSSGDSGSSSSDTGTTGTDTGPPDTTPPGKVSDLAGTPKTHAAVDLTWTAPADNVDAGTGTVAGYDVRYATTAITTVAEFLAATSSGTSPAPLPPGQAQTATVTGLQPATTYHFVLRARDAVGNFGDLSNDVTVTTKPRAKLLLTEVALANTPTEGFDFVELIVKEAGWAEGLAVKQFGTTLHTLGAIEVALDERIVVHATGLPGPTGFAQEDAPKSKTGSTAAFASVDAYDVYSTVASLTGTDTLITVNDGTAIVDAVAISNRDNDAATATMTGWAAAKTANAWVFAVTPMDATNDCESQRDAVSIAQPQQDLACGGYATGYAKGLSINRVNGTTDTNSKNDWFIGPQSPGGLAAAPPAPTVKSAIASSATSVDVTFDHEIDPATVVAGSFTIAGLAVTAATVTNVNVVTLTTAAQAGGTYQIDIAGTVKSSYGAAFVPPLVRFCGFTALPALVEINEVSPDLTGGADLIELKVTREGALIGYQVRQNPTTAAPAGTLLATLPGICGVVGDLIVVHLTPGATAAGETFAKNEQPTVAYSANYDTAYDVLGGSSGLGFSNQVVAIRNTAAAPAYIDAAVFSDMTTTSGATYLASVPFVQGLGLWLPADCGGATCTDASTPTIKGISADWRGVSSALPSDPSISRTPATPRQASSWVVGPSSFGL